MTTTTRSVDLNPVSPENLSNPSPLYKELRENDPVHWSDVLQAWLITRYDDLIAYCRDPRLSADRSTYYANQIKGLGEGAAEGFMRFARLQMTMRDGADHLRVRRPAQAAFSQRAIESWLPAIRRITSELRWPTPSPSSRPGT